jgi:radical SAM superfamily enzyme YgiQ (UPF0313 family)
MREAPPLDHALRTATPKPCHALLINPFYPKDPHASFGKHVLTPTLALSTVASATPGNWTVQYWDENLLQGPPPSDPMPSVVGISVHLTFAKRAYELADWYRTRGSKVVLGGLHVLSAPEEAAGHADAIVLGEGAQSWPIVLRDIEQGALKARYEGSYREPSYREQPPPRRDIVPSWGFLTRCSVIATRGCHNRCGFCYLSTKNLTMPYQMKDPEQVCAEIEQEGASYAVFIDNNLGSKRDYLRDLCRSLAPLEIIWSAAVSIDVTDDEDLVREMALAGCTGVFVGFESLAGENLDASRKKTPRPEDYARRVDLFHRNGIQVNGSFIFGFDEDGPDVFERTVEWVERNRLECATYHILTPYPRTPLFEQFEREGRLLHLNWEKYDTANVVFRPKRMTPEELMTGYEWAYKRTFSMGSIWRRRPARIAEVFPYLGMSLLYKKSNWLWPFLIKHRITNVAWRPLVEASRRRHLRFRKALAQSSGLVAVPETAIYPGV